MKFRRLPITSAQDTTQNFEQLEGILPNSKEPFDNRYLLQMMAPGHRITFGTAEVTWPVKGKESAVLAISTGLTAITVGFAQRVGSPQVVAAPSSISGGTLNVAAYFITGELEAGTKLLVFWLAIGT